MPAMANIVVLNNAGTNVTYTAAAPSAGDKNPAVWRANALSTIMGNRPVLRLLTRDNARANGRVIEGSFSFPVLQTISGVETVVAKVPLVFSGTLPTNVDATSVRDAFVQFGNLIASTLVRSSAEEGYAPT